MMGSVFYFAPNKRIKLFPILEVSSFVSGGSDLIFSSEAELELIQALYQWPEGGRKKKSLENQFLLNRRFFLQTGTK